MRLTLAKSLTLAAPLPMALAFELRQMFTIQNPEWVANERAGRWNGNTPETLAFYRQTATGVVVPRGALGLVIWLIRKLGYRWQLVDRRRTLPAVDLQFAGQLRPYQRRAARELFDKDAGVLEAPTGSGKTAVSLALIAERKQPALVLVHTKDLLNQWLDRIETFLGLPREGIGVVGDGRIEIGRPVTVATVQTLYKLVHDVAPTIGHLVVDECHRCPSRTFTEVTAAFDAKHLLGLSATPWRRDGLTKVIGWHLGPKVEITRAELTKADLVFDIEVVERLTEFATARDASAEYTTVLSELTQDPDRNALIADDVAAEAARDSGVCLVLTDRKAHCEALRDLIERRGCGADLLTGDLGDGQRRAVIDRVRAGAVPVLVATAQLIGEGFDAACLRALFLATPMTFSGRVMQSLGRILRPAPGKAGAKVFDYVDERVGVLRHAADRRRRVYASLGAVFAKPAAMVFRGIAELTAGRNLTCESYDGSCGCWR